MASPKIYFLKNEEGKFVGLEPGGVVFVNKICQARYVYNFKEIETKKPDYEFHLKCKLEIYQSTEDEFIKDSQLVIIQSVLAGTYFAQTMETLNYNLPTVSQVNKNLKNSIKNTLDKLVPITDVFKHFENSQEDTVFEVYGYFNEMMAELAEMDFYNLGEVTQVLRALKKDKNSILGISKKVLNH